MKSLKNIIKRVICFILCFSMILASSTPVGAEEFSDSKLSKENQDIFNAFDEEILVEAVTGSAITGSGITYTEVIASVTSGSGIEGILEGEGTAESPYIISTEEHLKVISEEINLDVDKKYDKKYFEIEKGIDIELKNEWVPIGTKENPFTGYFNGNNQTINNLQIGSVTSPTAINYQGFFGYNKGIVENITVTGKIISDGSYVGGIAGYSDGIMKNCTFGDEVNESYVKGKDHVGGIAGSLKIDDGSAALLNVLKNHAKISGGNNVGGICGSLSKNLSNGKYLELYNYSDIDGNDNIGGVIGFSNNTIKNIQESAKIKNLGNISATGFNAGGFIGKFNTTTFAIKSGAEIINNGDIHAEKGNAGGIVGSFDYYKDGSTPNITSAKITNTGDIKSGSDNVGGIFGYLSYRITIISSEIYNEGNVWTKGQNAGGIIGYIKNISNIDSFSNLINKGNINSAGNAGGIIGCADGIHNVTKSGLLNEGNIYADGNNAGGIIGFSTFIKFESIAAKDDITFKNTGCIIAVENAGGIVGNFSGLIFNFIRTDVLNEGMVKAEKNAGGFIGLSSANVTLNAGTIVNGDKGQIISKENAGGIFGSVKNVDIRINTKVENNGGILSENNAGGIAGLCIDSFIYSGEIENNSIVTASGINAGGIFGKIDFQSGTFNINRAASTGGYISAKENAGGIVGYSEGNINITNSYNKSYVEAEAYDGSIIGAVGTGSASIKNSFSYIVKEDEIKNIPLTAIEGAVIEHSYYLVDEGFDVGTDISAKKAEAFKYGEAAYLLDINDGGQRLDIWGQTLGQDILPMLKDGENHLFVYRNEIMTNDELTDVSVRLSITADSQFKDFGNIVYLNKGAEVNLSVTGIKENQALFFLPMGYVQFNNGNYKLVANDKDVMLTYKLDIDVEEDIKWYSGEEQEFYLENEAQLLGLEKLVNNGTADFRGKTLILSTDIKLISSIWTPIGTKENPFKGKFIAGENEGKHFEISNFNYSSEEEVFGLFGYIEDAYIKNITVNGKMPGGKSIGGISGNSKNSQFINCINNVNIIGSDIAGGITAVSERCIFEECKNFGSINLTEKRSNAGGISGVSYGEDIFKSCENKGVIQSAGNTGGIVSEVKKSSAFFDCINGGTVSGAKNTGGLVGCAQDGSELSKTVIENSFNSLDGIVSGKILYPEEIDESAFHSNTIGTYVGGIIGNAGRFTLLKNCGNEGKIESEANYSAGIAGSMSAYAAAENCYNSGIVENKGQYTAGGFGRARESKLEEIYNTGIVKGDGKYTGGIIAVGFYMGGGIKRCYNAGLVEGNGLFAAGISAFSRGNGGSSAYSTRIHESYNIGTVKGVANNTKVAGITGKNEKSSGMIGAYAVSCYNIGELIADNSSNIGAIGVENWEANQNSYYSQDSIPGNITPLDFSYATPLKREAFKNGEAAYLLDIFSDSSRKGLWGQGENYPVPAEPQNNLIYKISIRTSGSEEGFEGEGNNVNKIIYGEKETFGSSGINIFSAKSKEIALKYNEKEGYLLNTIAFDKNKLTLSISEDEKTIIISLKDGSDTDIIFNYIIKPENLQENYKVTYNANGGVWPEDKTQIVHHIKGGYRADKVSEPCNTSISGEKIIFTGWYVDKECSVEYDFTAAVVEDLVLYAGWTNVEQRNVIFDPNGGNFEDNEIIAVKADSGEKVGKPGEIPKREGYDFLGWYIDKECLHLYDFNRSVNSDFTLYAGWAKIGTCVVIFDANGGIFTDEDITETVIKTIVTVGEKINFPSVKKDPEGSTTFDLIGWYTEDGNEWDEKEGINYSMVLRAQWKANYFAIPMPGGVFTIDNFESFEIFRNMVNDGNNFLDTTFILTSDINLPKGWRSVGVGTIEKGETAGFRGIFDGGNHTITIDNYQDVPVFGHIGKEGVIKNLVIKGNTVYNIAVPGILTLYGEANNIHVYGKFYKCQSGIVGSAYDGALIENCKLLEGSVIDGGGPVGGIISTAKSASGVNLGPMHIVNCVVESGITITAVNGQSNAEGLGGIIGYGMGFIEGCSNGADLISKYSSGVDTGGILGTVNSIRSATISNCSNTGNITARGGHVGGIAGSLSNFLTDVSVEKSYSIGNITVTGESEVRNVGGIGGNIRKVSNCYWYGEYIDVPAGIEAGGIAGGKDTTIVDSYYGFKGTSSEPIKENTDDDKGSKGATMLTAKEFEAGKAAYLLDGGLIDGSSSIRRGIWTQDFEKGYPVLEEGASVYMITMSSEGNGSIGIEGRSFIETEDNKSVYYETKAQNVKINAVTDKISETEEYKLKNMLVVDLEGNEIYSFDGDTNIRKSEHEFIMPDSNIIVTAEFELQEKVNITPKITGFSYGATMTIGNAELGAKYIANIGDTVNVVVDVLQHPVVEGAISAKYYLKSIIVKFEDGNTLDITSDGSFIATGNAIVTAEIGEKIVFPSIEEPDDGDDKDDDNGKTPPVDKEIIDGGTGDGNGTGTGDGTGTGTGTGDGEGTTNTGSGTGTSENNSNKEQESTNTGNGTPKNESKTENNESKTVQSQVNPENDVDEEEKVDNHEEEQIDPPEEEEDKSDEENEEEAEEASTTPVANEQKNMIPPIAAAVSAILLILIGIYRFIILKRKKEIKK